MDHRGHLFYVHIRKSKKNPFPVQVLFTLYFFLRGGGKILTFARPLPYLLSTVVHAHAARLITLILMNSCLPKQLLPVTGLYRWRANSSLPGNFWKWLRIFSGKQHFVPDLSSYSLHILTFSLILKGFNITDTNCRVDIMCRRFVWAFNQELGYHVWQSRAACV